MNKIVLLPVFAQIALTFVLMLWMGALRYAAVKGRDVRPKDILLGQQAWPARVAQIDRAFHNQMELPVVFYALVAMVLAARAETPAFVWWEWLFVALRLAHAFVHVTSNQLALRFGLFVAGALTLIAMWLWFAARLYA